MLEYASYVFSFHGIGCGPFCFYDDYMAFIEGKNFEERDVCIVFVKHFLMD